jgi:hypothetical protein
VVEENTLDLSSALTTQVVMKTIKGEIEQGTEVTLNYFSNHLLTLNRIYPFKEQ